MKPGYSQSACLITVMLIAPNSVADQPVAASAIQGRNAIARQVKERDDEELEEDPERVQRYWNTSLSAEDYKQAVQLVRQMPAAGLRGGIALAPWKPVGPKGNFDTSDFNGRLTGIHIRKIGVAAFIYTGACSGGMWLTAANSPSWSSIGETLPNPSVRAFAIHPSNFLEILAGTGDWRRYPGAGMYRSLNGGTSWDEVILPVTPDSFFRIHYLPTNPNIVVAACGSRGDATRGGILRSTRGGVSDSWDFAHRDTGGEMRGVATDLVLHPTNPSIQYACLLIPGSISGRGVYKSTDSGATWTMLTDPSLPTGSSFDRASIAICRDAPQNLALLVEDDNRLQGVFKSTDGGDTWTNITTGSLANFGGNQVFHAQAIAFRPNDPQEIYVGAVGLAKTNDGGASWLIGSGEHGIDQGHADITQLYFSDVTGDDVLWILNDGGIYRHNLSTGVTETWNGEDDGGLRCSQIDYLDAELGMAAIGLQDNGVLHSAWSSSWPWNFDASGDGFGVEISSHLVDLAFWYIDGIWRSPNPSRRVWKLILGQPKVDTGNPQPMYNLFFDRFGDRMFGAQADTLWSTPASGSPNWTLEETLPRDNIREVFGSELTDDTVITTHWDGGMSNDRWVTVCHEDASSWDCTSHQIAPSGQTVEVVYLSHERLGESWAGLRGGVGAQKILHTTDYWNTWDDVTGDLTSVGRIEAITTAPFNPDQIFVGTDIGVFLTEGGGANWAPFQDGLPVVRCTDIHYVVDPEESQLRTLVVSTFGRGVYTRSLAGTHVMYVDLDTASPWDGTFEHPYPSFESGIVLIPDGGTLAIHGGTYNPFSSVTLSRPMTLVAYESTAVIAP